MELTYSNQLQGFDPDKRYRNPEHFDKPEAGVTSVLVIGNWPNVVSAYEDADVDVVVKDAVRVAVAGGVNQGELEQLIAELRAENDAVVFLVDGLKAGEITRPETGELANCLFDAFEAVQESVGELTTERDGLLFTVDALRSEIEALKKVPAAAPTGDAGEIEALKVKLDAANITYRANASKDALEKLVADLPQA
ncbi:hypothetical protein AV641_12490 [Pseudomonas fragi]|nr:hypothetical protein AV641_12490 [Pseudomonas fragi]